MSACGRSRGVVGRRVTKPPWGWLLSTATNSVRWLVSLLSGSSETMIEAPHAVCIDQDRRIWREGERRGKREIPSGGRRRELTDGQFQLLGTPHEIGQELFVDIDATLVFRQVSLVVCLQEDLWLDHPEISGSRSKR
jgi:hypothetical protein